jgi:hypothetical protein
MPHWKVDIMLLQLAVESVQRYRRITAREAAGEIGIPASTLTRLKDGGRPDVDAFISIVTWLHADPLRFAQRADGTPLEDDDRVLVFRRDVLLAQSWAREALRALPERQLPPPQERTAITAALQRLRDEVGIDIGREYRTIRPVGDQELAHEAHPAPQSAEG